MAKQTHGSTFTVYLAELWQRYSAETGEDKQTFAEKVGMDPSTWGKWINPEKAPDRYNPEILRRVSRAMGAVLGFDEYHLEAQWHEFKKPRVSASGTVTVSKVRMSGTAYAARRLPVFPINVIAESAGGDPLASLDAYPPGGGKETIWCPDEVYSDRNAYALKIEGDSMSPDVKNGEYVIVCPNRRVESGNHVVFKMRDGGVSFKRFRETEDFFIFKSANPDYEDIIIKKDDDRVEWIQRAYVAVRKLE